MIAFHAFLLGLTAFGFGLAIGLVVGDAPKLAKKPVKGQETPLVEAMRAREERHRPIAYTYEGETDRHWLTLSTPTAKVVVDKQAYHTGIRITLTENGRVTAVMSEPNLTDARITAEHLIKSTIKEAT